VKFKIQPEPLQVGFSGGVVQFADIPCSEAEIEEVAGYADFGNFFNAFDDPCQPDFVAVIIFGNNIKIFDFSGLAFYTVSFHKFSLF